MIFNHCIAVLILIVYMFAKVNLKENRFFSLQNHHVHALRRPIRRGKRFRSSTKSPILFSIRRSQLNFGNSVGWNQKEGWGDFELISQCHGLPRWIDPRIHFGLLSQTSSLFVYFDSLFAQHTWTAYPTFGRFRRGLRQWWDHATTSHWRQHFSRPTQCAFYDLDNKHSAKK